MRHWPHIFSELHRAQHIDIVNAFQCSIAHIGAKLLVAEHCEPFFQG